MVDARLTVPIYVTGSHVRLTSAHASALLDGPPTPLTTIGDTELRLCLETVGVRVGEISLPELRVIIGSVKTTEVHLARPLHDLIDSTETLHLDGPRGTVVLATPAHLATRELALTESDAADLGEAERYNVHVAGDRARVFNDVATSRARYSALWVEADDLNSLDLTPDARALVL